MEALEITTVDYGRRITDTENKLEAILAWKNAIKDATEVSQKLVEVGENLLIALRWVGIASKWSITIGGAFLVFYNAFKWLSERVH